MAAANAQSTRGAQASDHSAMPRTAAVAERGLGGSQEWLKLGVAVIQDTAAGQMGHKDGNTINRTVRTMLAVKQLELQHSNGNNISMIHEEPTDNHINEREEELRRKRAQIDEELACLCKERVA